MKQLNRLFSSVALIQGRGVFWAGAAVIAVLALSNSIPLTRAQATADTQVEDADSGASKKQAEVLDLLSAYHGALANGGNIELMGSLWADNSSLSLNNGTPFIGKAAVLQFFATGPYFSHNWVSLAPEWKTTIMIHGDIAQATTECIATDVSVSPNVVRGVIQVNATCRKINGQWLFIQMTNFSQPQI